VKRRVRLMPGFKSDYSACIILGGIGTIHMMCKQQANYARNPEPTLAEQFNMSAA
jgi:transposase-like protein